jgi:aspartyl-tRNA(Asn)/glutamyl-tRNA(Gln) amidotransferase subunit B
MNYKPVIGLEIHSELNTKTKMFCDSLNDPNETKPNKNVCPICIAYPGTLPVINIEAVRKVIKVGLALGAKINNYSWFERKNYFYPDLPKGYQISQFEKPFCEGGSINLSNGKVIRITRVHLEEDTGRLIHESQIPPLRQPPSQQGYGWSRGFEGQANLKSQKQGSSLVDFNRAGVPLMELVTEPEIENGKDAKEFGENFQSLLRYLNVSEADMEKGQLRIEANISIMPEGADKFGTKVEIKNLNSFRACERAIDYEIARQEKVLESGDKVVQETRGWNENKGETFSQRTKEESHDYRYFPEPDLPPIRLSDQEIESLRAELPELPSQRRERFISEYSITEKDVDIFTANKELGDYFEKVASELYDWAENSNELESKEKIWKLATNYLITELQKLLSGSNNKVSDLRISPEDFSELMVLIFKNIISSSAAQTILREMFETGADPNHVMESKSLSQMSDEGELRKSAQDIIAQNPQAVADYKKGKIESLKFLVGQLMRVTKGRANPQVSEEILKEILDNS